MPVKELNTLCKFFEIYGHFTHIKFCSQGARHTYSQMAGRNVANPTAMILAGVDMLDHMK